jgi:hypothetical protein
VASWDDDSRRPVGWPKFHLKEVNMKKLAIVLGLVLIAALVITATALGSDTGDGSGCVLGVRYYIGNGVWGWVCVR